MKILYFVDRCRTGGIQILLLNLFKAFKHTEHTCELLILDDGDIYPLEDQIKDMGIKVHKLDGIWLNRPTDYIAYRKAIDNFFEKHHDYDVVHINTGTKNFYILKCANKYNIPVRVAHSHNSGFQTKNAIKVMIGNVLKYALKKYANVYLACSDLAGRWLFGNNDKVIVLPNGINLDKFKYDEELRGRIRKELGVEDKIVIGNVGRFTLQKNHTFLIDIFEKIHEIDNNTVLVLVGIGELMEAIKLKVKKLNLEDCVLFLGYRTDVNDLTQGMDVFLMPSLYEGFPVTGVEAQASGLPCIFSDTITREVKILDAVKYISLYSPLDQWAIETLSLVNKVDRSMSNKLLHDNGYGINDMRNNLIDIYGAQING